MWWHIVANCEGELGFDWKQFTDVLRQRFYPEPLHAQKETEFMILKQENMTVHEYATKLITLVRFVPSFYHTDKEKIKHFQGGFN